MMKFNPLIESQWKKGWLFLNRVQGIALFPVSKNANTALRQVLGCSTHTNHSKENLSGYVKVACVRDPADRMISAYFEILKLRRDSEWKYTMSLPFYSITNHEDRFRQFLEDIKDNIYDTHILPQVYQIYRPLQVDYWILFEKFQKDLFEFIDKYHLKLYQSPKNIINKTQQKELQERLRRMMKSDKVLQERIKKMYQEDTELYNQIKDSKKYS